MLIRRGSAKAKHEARKAWLDARRPLMEGVPGINQDVDEAGSTKLVQLMGAMHTAGLFGKSTREVQRETTRRLVSELRGESVGVGW